MFRAEYDAWGRQNVVVDSLARFQRGFCGHEHWHEFALIDMNGRMYDPVISRFLSPDPFVQAPEDLQNYNRYSYCLNNPLKYTDPSGESIVAGAVIIGALAGAYFGGALANDSYKMKEWDFSSSETWAGMFWGAVVGGVSGYAGGAIATSGMPFANTASIAGSSILNSSGMYIVSGGKSSVSMSFGFASYDFTNNEWGYLGKKGNSKLENLGYGLGTLANVSDVLMGFNSQEVDLVTEHSDRTGHSAIVKHGTKTGGSYDFADPNGLISVGPDYYAEGAKGTWHYTKGKNTWNTYSNGIKKHPIWRESLMVNKKTLDWYADYLNARVALGKFHYSVEFSSCVTHTSMALNLSGVFNVGIHPYLLHAQMYLRNLGFRPCLNSYLIQ